jgi:hypothetical protein
MIDYRMEYRINKGNCECFRTDSLDKLRDKLEELRQHYPSAVYSTQSRYVRLDRYGVAIRDHKGRPQWGPWN